MGLFDNVKVVAPKMEIPPEDNLITYKQEINRLRKEVTEWKSLAEARYVKMKALSRKLRMYEDSKDSEGSVT